jgi:DNA-binding CsgD family transcriptional regulator
MAPPRRPPSGHHRQRILSPRELEVLADFVWFGEEETAARRGIAIHTVRRHLANARSKYGVSTTTQLVQLLGPGLPLPNGMAKFGE